MVISWGFIGMSTELFACLKRVKIQIKIGRITRLTGWGETVFSRHFLHWSCYWVEFSISVLGLWNSKRCVCVCVTILLRGTLRFFPEKMSNIQKHNGAFLRSNSHASSLEEPPASMVLSVMEMLLMGTNPKCFTLGALSSVCLSRKRKQFWNPDLIISTHMYLVYVCVCDCMCMCVCVNIGIWLYLCFYMDPYDP